MIKEPLKDLLPKFISDLQEKGRSPSTILAYRADLEQLNSFLLEKNKATPDDVHQEDIENFRDWLLSQKYTPKSASRKLNAVKTFFRWLKAGNVITLDPSRHVSHPKVEPSVPKFLSELEYRALRDVVRSDARTAAIVELILQTGMRISEVANLKLENIKNNKIVIEPHATQPQRNVMLNKPAKEAIGHYLGEERPDSKAKFLFISKNGKKLAIRNIRAAIDRYMERAGIPGYSVNDLRTTFIVENLKRGVDLVTVSQAAGHKRLSTTERYLELAKREEPGKDQELEEL